ncbi:CD63 antigen isoform X2 [Solenopsis invicta]|uniref:CD63 antigen isoform X2 n=1 Tax=Solenopsis invicta TaxID=13686 RepID=UPI000595DD70|nr:CD63 antigen isoform X2 [Solenopsis invicta]
MVSCKCFMKCLLFIVNLVILIFGTLVIIGSVFYLNGAMDRTSTPLWIKQTGYTNLDVVFIASLGILIISIAIFGIVAALREVECMILTSMETKDMRIKPGSWCVNNTYGIIMSLSVMIAIIVNALQYNYNKEKIEFKQKMKNNKLQFYYDDNIIRNFWDVTQSTYQCCGVNNWEDWKTHGLEVPDSCCKLDQLVDCIINRYTENVFKAYEEGCITKAPRLMQHYENVANISRIIFINLMIPKPAETDFEQSMLLIFGSRKVLCG